MKIENKLTLAHLRLNKKRTVITILGIVVSVAMIVSVSIGFASFFNYLEKTVISQTDNAHFYIWCISDERIEILNNDDRVKSVGLVEDGRKDTSGVRVENAKSLRHSVGYINWYNNAMFEQMSIDNLTGRFPSNKNEIMLSRQYINDNDFDWDIGDTIKLQLGRRYNSRVDDVFHLSYSNEYNNSEDFELSEKREFKLVGIIEDKLLDYKINQMYSICDENSSYNAYIQLKRVTPFSMLTIKDIASELGINFENKADDNLFLNDELLATHLCGTADSDMLTKYIPMGFAIMLIILVASFMLIYNAFGISVGERISYLGMLASIGATKIQKRRSVYFEGFVLGIIGIPVGTALGILIMLVGIKIINAMGSTSIPISFVMPLWVIALAIVLCVATILVSLRIPARKASLATPIEAIKRSNYVEVKHYRSSKLLNKLFGVEGNLAYKNYRRNGKRSRLVVASIAISCILFLCVNYYCSITTDMVEFDFERPYQVEFSVDSITDVEKTLNDIKAIDGVDRVYSIYRDLYHYGESDFDFSSDRRITEGDNTTSKYKDLWNDVSLFVNFIDDKDFDELCRKNNIDSKQFYSKNKRTFKCLVMNNIDHKSSENKVFNNNLIGQIISNNPYQCFEYQEYREDMGIDDMTDEQQKAYLQEVKDSLIYYEVAGFVDYDESNYVCNLNSKRAISAYVPFSMIPCLTLDDFDGGALDYGVETEKHEEVTEKIRTYFDEHIQEETSGVYAIDSYGYALQAIQLNKTIKIFMYGFIALISLITLANIINVITTSIGSRRREFAMIKSIGITPKGFNKMISLENMFLGLEALGIAIPLSIIINILLNKFVADGRLPFEVNILTYIICIIGVFAFVGLTMLYSVNKIKNDNIIENLKKDEF